MEVAEAAPQLSLVSEGSCQSSLASEVSYHASGDSKSRSRTLSPEGTRSTDSRSTEKAQVAHLDDTEQVVQGACVVLSKLFGQMPPQQHVQTDTATSLTGASWDELDAAGPKVPEPPLPIEGEANKSKCFAPRKAPGKQDKTLMCKFWLQRRCAREDCNFAHSEKEQRQACKRIACRFDLEGSCKQGAACWYRHTGDSSSDLPEPIVESSSCMPCFEDEIPINVDQRMVDTGSLNCRPTSEDSKSTDKTLICKFWLKNRCQRTSDCKFAHGEAEQRAACKKLRCRFDMTGTCRQGDRCWYLHDRQRSEQSTPMKSTLSEQSTKVPVTPVLGPQGDSAVLTPSFAASVRMRIEKWADLSDSDEEFCPREIRMQGFPTLVTS